MILGANNTFPISFKFCNFNEFSDRYWFCLVWREDNSDNMNQSGVSCPSSITNTPSSIRNQKTPPFCISFNSFLTSSLQPSLPHQLTRQEKPLSPTAFCRCNPSFVASSALIPGPNFETVSRSVITLRVQKLVHVAGRCGRSVGWPSMYCNGAKPQSVAMIVHSNICWTRRSALTRSWYFCTSIPSLPFSLMPPGRPTSSASNRSCHKKALRPFSAKRLKARLAERWLRVS